MIKIIVLRIAAVLNIASPLTAKQQYIISWEKDEYILGIEETMKVFFILYISIILTTDIRRSE